MNIAAKPSKLRPRSEAAPSVEVASTQLHARMKKANGPVLLTRKGRATAVALNLKSYRHMVAEIERLETLVAIARGLEDARQGRVRPWEEVRAELEREFGLSGRDNRRRRG